MSGQEQEQSKREGRGRSRGKAKQRENSSWNGTSEVKRACMTRMR